MLTPRGADGRNEATDQGTAGPARKPRRSPITLLARYGTPAATLLLIVLFTALEGTQFLSVQNFTNVISQSAIGIVISLGLTFVLMVGEFDLSIGYIASFAGILVAGHYDGGPVEKLAVIGIVVALGGFIGLMNGLLVTKLGVSALVATLGVGTLVVGANYWISGGAPLTLPAGGTDLTDIYLGSIGPVPTPIVLVAGLIAIAWLLQSRTTWGLELRAVGGNRAAAVLSGIRVGRLVILSFVISGLLAAAGGVLIVANVGSGQATGGNGFLLTSFAACFLGSVALRDGEFHVLGTVLGVITVAIGANGLAIYGVNASSQYLFQGGLLIVAVGLSTSTRRLMPGRQPI